MQYRSHAFLTVLTLIVLSGAQFVRAQTPDRVFFQGEQSPRRGLVVEEPLNNLVWKPKSERGSGYFNQKETSWNKIRGIRFGEQPENYRKARSMNENGENLDQAVQLLDEILEKKEVNRSFFIPRALYLKADIRFRQASDEEGYRRAMDVYDTAIEQYPDNRGFFNAIQRKVRLHRQLGEMEKALEAADRLIERNPRSRGKSLGALRKAQIYRELENYEQAVEQSRAAMGSTSSTGLEIRARRILADSLIKLERYEDARTHYQKLIDQKDRLPRNIRDQILVSAHNGVGRTIYHRRYTPNAGDESVQQENVQALKDALLHFLKGVVWYRPRQNGSTIEHQRALYWTARSFVLLTKNVNSSEQGDQYALEARRAMNELLNNYPDSEFRIKVQRLRDQL